MGKNKKIGMIMKKILLLTIAIFFTGYFIINENLKRHKSEATEKVEKLLEKKFNLSPQKIQALRNDHNGLKTIAVAALIAEETNKSIDEIIKMKKVDKKEYSDIAKEFNVSKEKLDNVSKEIEDEFK